MNKTIIIFFTLLVLFINYSISQNSFFKTYGGYNNDKCNNIFKTPDNGYCLVGNTDSYGSGQLDYYLIKTDSVGNVEWTKTYGNPSNEHFSGFGVLTNDNGYVLTGHIHDPGGKLLIIKTDSLGNLQWDKIFEQSNANIEAFYINNTDDNGFIITGYVYNFTSSNITDIYLLKIDSIGNMEWTISFVGSGYDYGKYVEQTDDRGFIIFGETDSYGAGSSDIFLLKTDSIGNLIWFKTYGGINTEIPKQLEIINGNEFIFVGETESYGNNTDIIFTKIDEQGNIIWSKSYGGSLNETDPVFSISNDNELYVYANSNSFGNSSLLFKTDSLGNIVWSKKSDNDFLQNIPNQMLYDNTYNEIFIAGTIQKATSLYTDIFLQTFDSIGQTTCDYSPVTLQTGSPILTISDTIPLNTFDGSPSNISINSTFHPSDCIWMCQPNFITIPDEKEICLGSDVMLEVIGGSSYNWSPIPSLSNLTISNPIASPSLSTTYTVTITDEHNCIYIDSVTVHVNDTLFSNADFSFIDTALTVYFYDNSTNASSWLWEYGDGATDSIQNPVHTYSLPGTYYTCLTISNLCGTDIFCDSINVIQTEISNINNQEYFIYPNPTSRMINLYFNYSENKIYTFELFDIFGQNVRTINNILCNKVVIDLNNVNSGIYYYILFISNEEYFNGKIIKQ